MGQMDSPRQQLTALYSNVSLVQAQAIVVSLVASLVGRWWWQMAKYSYNNSLIFIFT
jgi:hypothetical protein